jgi:hypothetical protein
VLAEQVPVLNQMSDAVENPLVAGLKAGQWPSAKADPVGLTCWGAVLAR